MRRRDAAPRAGEHGGGVLTSTLARRLLVLFAVVGLGAIVVVIARAPATSTATGVVVAVDSVSLTKVTAFTIREADGGTRRFAVGSLENGVEFPPGHLVEHIASGVPVVVTYRDVDGVATAIRLADAVAGPSPTVSPGAT